MEKHCNKMCNNGIKIQINKTIRQHQSKEKYWAEIRNGTKRENFNIKNLENCETWKIFSK